MTYYALIGLLLLAGIYLGTIAFIRWLDGVNPKKLKQGARWTAGAAAAVAVLVLILTGRSGVAIGLATATAPFFLPRRWNAGPDAPNASSQPPKPPSGGMSREEACAILGIEPDASAADVRAAHKRLIKACHPDHGGTDALAAKVNHNLSYGK